MFTKQDSESQQFDNERFYKLQQEFIEKNNLTSRKNDYLSNDFFQYIVTTYQIDKTNSEIGWLFGKALDILIRNNISSKSFIQYNEESKQDFYSNAMYRCNQFTINSFKPDKNAFIYFTSTINNAFKDEINKTNEQKSIAKKQYITSGLDAIMYNVDVRAKEELHQEYIIDKVQEARLSDIPLFIQEVFNRYAKDYKIVPISLVEEEDVHRFQRKYQSYKYFMKIHTEKIKGTQLKSNKEKITYKYTGIVFEYVDVSKINENNGTYKTYLQKRALIARKNGNQCFFLFSDIWNDKDIEDKLIFKRIDTLISSIKENVDYNLGKDLMMDYIPYSLIEKLGITEPAWWLLQDDNQTRHIVMDQDVKEYLRLKEVCTCTRVFDAGKLNLK